MKYSVCISVLAILALSSCCSANKTTTSSVRSAKGKGNGTNATSRLPLIKVTASIFQHLNWGNESTRIYPGTRMLGLSRRFSGYGPCPPGRIVTLDHIRNARMTKDVLEEIREILQLYCKPEMVEMLERMYEKGYMKIALDNSIYIPKQSPILFKAETSYQETDEIGFVLEVVGVMQVVMSWFAFPVNTIDPSGAQIPDHCFIELVARFHALDILISLNHYHLTSIVYDMSYKGRHLAKRFYYEYLNAYQNPDVPAAKTMSQLQRCIALTMAYVEFLTKSLPAKEDGVCVHDQFKRFYLPKMETYMKKTRDTLKQNKLPYY